eukprot:TRINITY_DN688_c0_g1_i2.p2 TRINITY_DN688_c0_g1~~TRINITY_DN688_c0_g1_i2.p2  ORF type:complete len:306 (+),score=87.47 TRINITY_DN688_c0_g1_i2:1053-1970(+)
MGLTLVMAGLSLLFSIGHQDNMTRMIRKMKGATLTTADYSVQVRHLPKSLVTSMEIQNFFSIWGEVAHVTIGVDAQRLIELHKRRKIASQALETLVILIRTGHKKPAEPSASKFRPFLQRIGFFRDVPYWEHELEIVNAEIDRIVARKEGFQGTGRAFVTFEDPSAAANCKHAYRRHYWINPLTREGAEKFDGKYYIAVEEAPEPADVIWENLGVGKTGRFLRQLMIGLISLFLILFGAIIVTFMLQLKGSNQNGFLSLLISVGIVCLNWLLMQIFVVIVPFERHHSRSALNAGLVLKLFLAPVL